MMPDSTDGSTDCSTDGSTGRKESRRARLKRLLEASERRQQRQQRPRRKLLAAGMTVEALAGELTGRPVQVLDADYILNRVLVSADGHVADAVWLDFHAVRPI